MHQPIEQPLVPVSGETPTGAAATPRASFRAPTGFAASKFLVVTASGPEIYVGPRIRSIPAPFARTRAEYFDFPATREVQRPPLGCAPISTQFHHGSVVTLPSVRCFLTYV